MLTIRTARKDEVEDLQKLNAAVCIDNHRYDEDLVMDWSYTEKAKEYFTKILNNPDAFCLIAEDDGKKIGYLAANKKIFGHRKSRYFEVENIGVVSEYRSKGIGTKLLKKSIAWGKKKGFQKVFLDAYIGNTNAIQFYKKNGFTEIGISFEKKI